MKKTLSTVPEKVLDHLIGYEAALLCTELEKPITLKNSEDLLELSIVIMEHLRDRVAFLKECDDNDQ